MIEATARVPTSNAATYLLHFRRLWAHRLDINVRDQDGVVHFEDGLATLTPAEDQLVVTILARNKATMRSLQAFFAMHLERLSPRDCPLRFDWQSTSDLPLHAL
jgi:hypothetical protein